MWIFVHKWRSTIFPVCGFFVHNSQIGVKLYKILIISKQPASADISCLQLDIFPSSFLQDRLSIWHSVCSIYLVQVQTKSSLSICFCKLYHINYTPYDLIYSGLLKIRTRMCKDFWWKSGFFGEVLFLRLPKVRIFWKSPVFKKAKSPDF